MEFTKEFLSNRVYDDQPLMFNPLLKEKTSGIQGEELDTGALVQPNGDIIFRIYAPNAKEVEIKIRGQANTKRGCVLAKGEDGIFEGVYPYDETFCGPHSIDILVDGMCIIYPYIPIMWHRNKPVNFIEVPDPETTYININDVPHGAFTREIYWSNALNTWQRCSVYTPPGYQKSGEEYPVLYLLHGSTENETCWEYNGRVGYIMDNLIAEGKAKPFVIVMNDGMVRKEGEVTQENQTYATFEKSLIESCVPFIEETYRVKTDKWNRAIAGLSMGSTQSFIFGLRHPELFGYIGLFSGSLSRDGVDPVLLEKVLDPEYMGENYRVFFRSIGDAETRTEKFIRETELAKERGLTALPCYHDALYKYQTHEWGAWRRAIYDYAQLIFK